MPRATRKPQPPKPSTPTAAAPTAAAAAAAPAGTVPVTLSIDPSQADANGNITITIPPHPDAERRDAAQAEVQRLLDRFVAHRFGVAYQIYPHVAASRYLLELQREGVLDTVTAEARMLEIQAEMLREEFARLCTARDEQQLAAKQPAQRSGGSGLAIARR